MFMHLELKKECEFFWLREIEGVDISQCCMKCFLGTNDKRVYAKSRNAPTVIDIEIYPSISLFQPLAYYLCGLSKHFNYSKNSHVAFNPSPGDTVNVDNDEIKLTITDAKRIDFEKYRPNPEGVFTNRQRTCRNWIFANYIKDGMPL